jgi:hypothetical protein
VPHEHDQVPDLLKVDTERIQLRGNTLCEIQQLAQITMIGNKVNGVEIKAWLADCDRSE